MHKNVEQNKKNKIILNKSTHILRSMNKGNLTLPGIGETLIKRQEKSKIHMVIIVSVLVFAILLKSLFSYHLTPARAQSGTILQVNLSEYIIDATNSSYYAWRGNVTISGSVNSANFQTTSLVGYIDTSLTPVFSILKSDMSLTDDQYSFTAIVDSSKYSAGYHVIRIYDGPVNSIPNPEKQPVWEFPIYIEDRPFAQVNANSRLREEATTLSTNLLTVDNGSSVEVFGQVKGEYLESYGTDIWYDVKYTDDSGTSHDGYILSSLVDVLSFSDIEISIPGVITDDFDSFKKDYELHVPFNVSSISFEQIVRAEKDDQVSVTLNGNQVNPPYNNLLLSTGDNEIIINYSRGPVDTALNISYKYNIWRIAETTEAEFQAQLAKFPESYRQPLLALHSKYPNWLFVAHNLDFEWNYVIDKQFFGTNSLIWSPPHDLKPIEYVESYTIIDGTSFVKASKAAIEYYVDPRNFFNETRIFQFEQLSYNSAVHTLNGLQQLFAKSGHAGKESMFLKAGQESNLSPYHLASRSRLELGNPLSIIATGQYSEWSGKYLGLYNFYNIGTGGSITDRNILIRNGLEFALGNYPDGTPRPFTPERYKEYQFPWDTEQKAITGGARYIGNNYINRGQDTLYYQKFNPVVPGTHQYMQNIQAPYHESSGIFNAYKTINSLYANILFKIPVYKNMPELPTPKPDDTNKLNSLSVSGATMSPVFNPDVNGLYTASVPYNIEKITISATTLNSKATISGTGEKSIVLGDNDFTVSVTPSNGLKREYKILVTRMPPDDSNDNSLKSLWVEGLELSKVFEPEDLGPYVVYVPIETEKAVISAEATSPISTIVGDGEKILNHGLNDYSVTVNAQDGSKRIYRIQIIRIPEEEKSEARLKSLAIENSDISPEFSEDNPGLYKAVVSPTTLEVKIIAESKSQFSSVTGTGDKNLVYGKNSFTVTVIAFDGTQKNYTIEITREKPVVPTVNYVFSDTSISGINLSTTVKEMKDSLKTPLISYKFTDSSKKVLADSQIIGTGNIIEVYIDDKKETEYRTLIFGDLNGDGKVNILDFLILRSHLLGINKLSDEKYFAADVNKDNKINVLDMLMTRAHILGLIEINQK